ncbi:methionine--tRNA ligase [uncultured Helicobacter sp.]|uniref:methionine--tRNA ligase n=1 Tax=uncultured Helicobacter sp. TaxID=175537 RepID=UPI00374E9611
MKKSYITSPIYYVNDVPHIGHAYTTIICDMLKKYRQIHGQEVFLLTGTDEHGQKIENSAKAHNQTPQAYADSISAHFRTLWEEFGIDFDYFIRTTDSAHCQSAQVAFKKMFQKGDIYKGVYEGWYCISCESHFTKHQVVEQKCPDCGKPTTTIKEESYFFALSKYQNALLQWYEQCPDVIVPKHKRNEVIRFVESGLVDLSITRTGFSWGVPLPEGIENAENAPKHILYVWLDALISYISVIGYESAMRMDLWENATHIVGKDILRFHAVYWPAFLMSLGLPLPRKIYAHGWWTRDGVKMSKSIGNVVNPKEVAQSYGIEAFRYFLLREVPFGQDGDFSQRALIERINSDLSNDIGNLLNRLIGMAQKYFNLTLFCTQIEHFYPQEVAKIAPILERFESAMSDMQPHIALEELWGLLRLGNNVISTYEPWKMMKQGESEPTLALLMLVSNILLKTALCLYPIMPRTAKSIATALGCSIDTQSFTRYVSQNTLLQSATLTPIAPLFPRIESPLMPEPSNLSESTSQSTAPKTQSHAQSTLTSAPSLVSIEEFAKLDLRVGVVLECERVPKSEKLLKFLIDLGESTPRQILSGIAKYYDPSELVGKQVCVVANLRPVKLMGLLSSGMILSAHDDEGLSLLSVPKKAGSKIS